MIPLCVVSNNCIRPGTRTAPSVRGTWRSYRAEGCMWRGIDIADQRPHSQQRAFCAFIRVLNSRLLFLTLSLLHRELWDRGSRLYWSMPEHLFPSHAITAHHLLGHRHQPGNALVCVPAHFRVCNRVHLQLVISCVTIRLGCRNESRNKSSKVDCSRC